MIFEGRQQFATAAEWSNEMTDVRNDEVEHDRTK